MSYLQNTEIKKNMLLEIDFPIRWSDMDAFGHVNNSIYFRYFEIARTEWLTQLNYQLTVNNLVEGPTIVDAHCQFITPVVYPALLNLAMYGGTPGRSSFDIYYEIREKSELDKLYCNGNTRLVWIDFIKGSSIAIPEKIRNLLPH